MAERTEERDLEILTETVGQWDAVGDREEEIEDVGQWETVGESVEEPVAEGQWEAETVGDADPEAHLRGREITAESQMSQTRLNL